MKEKKYLDEVAGSNIDQNVLRIVKSSGNVERSGERNKHFLAERTKREMLESGRSDLETSGGGANVGETVLEKIHFQICLFFHCFQLLHTHPLQRNRSATTSSLRRCHSSFSLALTLLRTATPLLRSLPLYDFSNTTLCYGNKSILFLSKK